jgi:TolA-binding protein
MMAVLSLRDVIDRGVELQYYEAVAIAQQLIALLDGDVQPKLPLGPPSLDSVRLGPDGSVICSTCATGPAVSEIAILLQAMLPRGGTTRVPGALRYTIARALCDVDAPPFGSLAELSAALMRQEAGDRFGVLRDLYSRATATPPRVVALNRERRRHTPSVSELRRQLRDVDKELFLLVNATKPTASRWARARRSWTLAEVLVVGTALVGLLAVGVTTVRQSAGDSGPGARAEILDRPAVEPRETNLTGVVGVRGDLPSKAPVTTTGRDPGSLRTPGAGVKPADQEMQIARKQIDLKRYDEALATLRDVVARRPNAAAYFLIASVQETQGRLEDARATYLDIARRFPGHARAPEAVFCLARCILRSRRPSKTVEARTLFGEVAAKYPASAWAPRALIARGELEERDRLYLRDNILATSVPMALVTYRKVVQQYPASPERATALWKLGRLYETDRRYDRAAETFTELAKQYPRSEYDAWFRAAEIYDRRLKDRDRARATYQRVPPISRHFNEAQKRLRQS